MWLVFLFSILILGIIYSSLEAKIYSINILEKDYNFKVIISFKLFGILKIFSFRLDKIGIHFFSKKIVYKKVDKEKIDFELFKQINLKLKKSYFTLRVGIEDVFLTNIVLVLLSSLIPVYAKEEIKKNNLKYKILPEYNKICLRLDGKINLSVKVFNLIKLYFKNKTLKFTHNKSKNYGVKESF